MKRSLCASRVFGARRFSAWLALLLTALLVGCVTPDARIKRNQAIFDALPPAEQALIREGKVGIGFTPEMVRLAVGDPDQRWMRTDAKGESESWSYTTYDTALGDPLYSGLYHRYHGGYPVYYDGFYRRDARAREVFKVVFTDGRVSEIIQEAR
jgi:hypothetical protein